MARFRSNRPKSIKKTLRSIKTRNVEKNTISRHRYNNYTQEYSNIGKKPANKCDSNSKNDDNNNKNRKT